MKKSIPLFALSLGTLPTLQAADVTLTAADAINTSSFNSAGNWSNAEAPSAANDYFISIQQLRTPANGEDHTFAGNSLTLEPGGKFMYKGTGAVGVLTVENLILNGGFIRHANGPADVMLLDGAVNVTADSAIIPNQGAITILAPITGSANLSTGNEAHASGYTLTFASDSNDFTGNLIVTGGTFALEYLSNFGFVIGANGEANQISGPGTANLNGVFAIDLGGASSSPGDQWNLVTTASSSFRLDFAISGWTDNEDTTWSSPGGAYRFSTLSGTLFVDPDATTDSDNNSLPDRWEIISFGALGNDPDGDPDGDLSSNADEFAAGTHPNDDFDYPDTDEDYLPDGWELLYFGNLDGKEDDDPDGDSFTNGDELNDGTDPTDIKSSGDFENDGLADGWEILYFAEDGEDISDIQTLDAILARQDGLGDPDGDGANNEAEETADSDPTNASSTPADTDGDGLSDAWERANFGDLSAEPGQNPDGDAFDNLAEQNGFSDPNNISSTPSDADGNGTPDSEESPQPYTVDAHTLILYHMDANWGSLAVPNAANPGTFDGVGTSNETPTTVFQAAPSFRGFGGAGSLAANKGVAVDSNGDDLFRYDSSENPDHFDMSLLGPGFTLEGLINVPELVGAQHIWGGDGAGVRTFQFRLASSNITFDPLPNGGGDGPLVTFDLATLTGEHAFVPNEWFHVAMTYDSTTGETKFYWTRLDSGAQQANLVHTGTTSNFDFNATGAPLVFGNEGRSTGGTSEGVKGLLDEGRVSNIVREANDFLFGDGTPVESDLVLAIESKGQLSWNSSAGKTYTIERSTTLQPQSFIVIADNLPASGTGTTTYNDGDDLEKAFYRVRESN
ncbi:LamG-like jellyroll fold domain-containing protein [Roseibacillus ishigakijimensis]|uniref:Concanavalin A-like lectin/glucanases superfamily protein n=1 Tax=Roseibacillus ishigakijimensis TaxID=454146 RepID=A0A934RUV8_9BACT|nr:LamG-like jellyroll fold domain-containing protein [Roseibacillus ishigakijimensis]MBK1834600.1 hypothetical protein [Roseibacillus ishigakijimensis]